MLWHSDQSLIPLNLYSVGSLISIGFAALTLASWKPFSVELRMPLFCSYKSCAVGAFLKGLKLRMGISTVCAHELEVWYDWRARRSKGTTSRETRKMVQRMVGYAGRNAGVIRSLNRSRGRVYSLRVSPRRNKVG